MNYLQSANFRWIFGMNNAEKHSKVRRSAFQKPTHQLWFNWSLQRRIWRALFGVLFYGKVSEGPRRATFDAIFATNTYRTCGAFANALFNLGWKESLAFLGPHKIWPNKVKQGRWDNLEEKSAENFREGICSWHFNLQASLKTGKKRLLPNLIEKNFRDLTCLRCPTLCYANRDFHVLNRIHGMV